MSKVNAVELAKLFVEYKELSDKQAEVESKIQEQVLLMGESQKIAGVTATYYQESVTVDYKTAAEVVAQAKEFEGFRRVVENNTKLTPSISWKNVAEVVGVEDYSPWSTPKPARVVVKV